MLIHKLKKEGRIPQEEKVGVHIRSSRTAGLQVDGMNFTRGWKYLRRRHTSMQREGERDINKIA